MPARRASYIVCLTIVALSSGCSLIYGPPAPPPASSAPVMTQYPPPATQPVDAPASPDALALKVYSYRHDVESQLDRAATRPAAQAASPEPTTQPVAATTVDLNTLATDLRLTPYPQETRPPHAGPDEASAPAAATTGAPTGDANFPLTVPENADRQAAAQTASAVDHPAWNPDQTEHQIAQHLRDYPKDMEGQLDYELLMFVEGQPVPQLSALAGLRAEDREILTALMDGLSNFRSVVSHDDNLLLVNKIKPLSEMTDRLAAQAELSLPTVALCSEVKSYGVYTPVQSNRFIAGRTNNQVIVYAEVQNFQSQMTTDSQWQTRLSEEMVLYTDAGLPVWPSNVTPQTVVDLCRERRHDFFIGKLITLPANLTIGRYLLKVTVTDQLANHVAEATTPIEVVAQ
jgi:hypothetical protein